MKIKLVDLGRVSVETKGLDHGQMFERIEATFECVEPQPNGLGTGDWDMHPGTGLCTINA